MELLHNLPALVVQLKALRDDMKRQSKLYDSLFSSTDPLQPTVPTSFDSSQNGMRGSIFTPFSDSMPDSRASQVTLEDLSSLNTALDETHYANTMVSRQSTIMGRQKQQGHRRSTRFRQTRSAYSMNTMSMGPEKFTVMWVSGECGISLRNFSRNESKVGAQIAMLQHADGITTGISNCKLGDQLVTINDERVDALRFSEIVEKLKLTQCPISLGFRTNASVQTSPRAASSPSNNFRNSTGMSRLGTFFAGGGSIKSKKVMEKSTFNRHSMSGVSYANANKSFGHDSSSDMVHETIGHPGYEDLTSKLRSSSGAATMTLDRSTTTSVSSSSTLSDELEIWCREQEEMHSVIIVLLTETIMRCEKLQQENLDQLQNLMQLSASSSQLSDSSTTVSYHAGAERVSNVENQLDVLDADFEV